MNDELQKALSEVLNTGVDAKDFILSEMPDVINQILMWHGVVSGIKFICFFILCYAIYKINKVQIKYFKGKYIPDHPELMINFLQLFLFIPIGFLWSISWLQILIAPKLYLIEYAARLAGAN